ncbi:AAA family ATPase [Desulfosporosinus fructosivorans]|uniref:AAA family ATPase n=1 Tax=Desulfosporosinus fructosivorans TaxID=2018669 RepID=A0A4Z0R118_9FIRM|nr:ATP-binding protein [Desulfosporosinus fructosivorans]TGE36681.1 AAA family ATPase [Desulfosporosinus fructosivorans]
MLFVGGVHGVGKSYFCGQVEIETGLKVYSASKLISELRNEEFTVNKKVNEINDNQGYLLEAMRRLSTLEGEFLLDGHFCLLNGNGVVQRIPIATFKQLSPKAIIVLYDTVETIISRLNKRDNVNYEFPTIEALQKEELNYSQEVSIALGVPYLAINNASLTESACTFIIEHKI